MTLQLPQDAEAFLPTDGTFEWLHDSAVYALALSKPENPAETWDAHYEHRPEWLSDFIESHNVLYVGSSTDVLARLTDHKDGEKRLTVLTEICEIDGIRTIWWHPGHDRKEIQRREREWARVLDRQYPETFVRQQ